MQNKCWEDCVNQYTAMIGVEWVWIINLNIIYILKNSHIWRGNLSKGRGGGSMRPYHQNSTVCIESFYCIPLAWALTVCAKCAFSLNGYTATRIKIDIRRRFPWNSAVCHTTTYDIVQNADEKKRASWQDIISRWHLKGNYPAPSRIMINGLKYT